MACSPAGKFLRLSLMFTPFLAGESSAVPTLFPIPSRISTLTVFFAVAENAVEITSAAAIAIVLCSRIRSGLYPNLSELFALKNFCLQPEYRRLHRLPKNPKLCHSERGEESLLFLFLHLNRKEIL